MALKSRILGSFSVIVVSVMIWDCMALIPIRGALNRKQGKKPQPITACKFGNKNFSIGHEWNPHLEPDGINYCIKCRCKKDGLVRCEGKRCKAISCPGQLVPSGKCCPVCPSPQVNKKQCQHDGKHYHQGEIWNIPMKKDIVGDNNCAECTCHNGKVSCAVRICPRLKCSAIMQVQGKDSCCRQCRGFPLMPFGGLPGSKPAVNAQGSCFQKGRYYKNKDMWNPLASASEPKVFQKPNCDLCMCQNTEIKCKTLLCPKLECDNPIQKDANDCCTSCPDKKTVEPVTNHTLLGNITVKKPKGVTFPDCIFLSTTYKHNSSWTPRIPGHDPNSCVRCTCEFSRIKCNRDGCRNTTTCRGHSCSIRKTGKTSLPLKPRPEKSLCNSGDRVEIYLLVNEKSKPSKRLKTKQNYVARIAVISPKKSSVISKKKSSVNVHVWDVADDKATLKSSWPSKSRFQKRKTNYVKLGETKIGRINRFFNKEKTLKKCNRSCKTKARDFINILKNRVILKCESMDLFRILKPSRQ